MSEDKKKQEPRKNEYTLKGFLHILQGKPAESRKSVEEKEKRKS